MGCSRKSLGWKPGALGKTPKDQPSHGEKRSVECTLEISSGFCQLTWYLGLSVGIFASVGRKIVRSPPPNCTFHRKPLQWVSVLAESVHIPGEKQTQGGKAGKSSRCAIRLVESFDPVT